MARALTALEREVLEFERSWFRYPGRRAALILERFGVSEARYSQRLLALIDRPAALEYDATTVARLRRLRDERAATRATINAGGRP